ncbi:hypothetical protein MKW92_042765, partial [Papaver armeniacum]
MDEHNKLGNDNGSSQVLNCEPQEDNDRIQRCINHLLKIQTYHKLKEDLPKMIKEEE